MFFDRSLKILRLLFLKLISIETIDCFTNSNAENVKKKCVEGEKALCVQCVCFTPYTSLRQNAKGKMKNETTPFKSIKHSLFIESAIAAQCFFNDWLIWISFVCDLRVSVHVWCMYVGPRVFALFYVILLLWLELNLKKQKTTTTKRHEIDVSIT